jgi:hypothetical protein
MKLPDQIAAQFGIQTMSAAQFFNFMVTIDLSALSGNNGGSGSGSLPQGLDLATVGSALSECGLGITALIPGNFNPAMLIGCLSPETISYLAENDPTFLPNLLLV